MTYEYVLPLAAPSAMLENAGGKGASLARLANAGLSVPDGFHVTTDAHKRFVADSNLQPAILEAVRAADPAQPATLAVASRTIADLFAQAPMPRQIAEAVARAYAELPGDDPVVAVRSSATAEDLPGLSFAGQQETYLNIHGLAAVLDAVQRCWASLWTARAIGYRLKMGIDQQAVAMAVVVQTMVPAEVAGVLFTANPTTGERDELIVSASYGLGEAIVGGQVTPDTFVLERPNLALKRTVLGTKEVMVVPSAGQGTTTRAVSEDRRVEQALSAELARKLGELAIRVEQEFGGVPQDIEWAVAEGRCYILQARPMTGLPPAPLKDVRWEPPVRGSTWVRRQVAENMPEPLSPLFDELYLREGMDLSMDKVLEMAGKSGLVSDSDRPWYTTVNGYAYLRGSFTVTWGILLKSLGAVASGKIVRAVFSHGIPYWRDEVLPSHLALVQRWQGLDLTSASDEQLLGGIRELARAEAVYWGGTNFALGVARASDIALNRFLAIVLPRSGLTSALFLRGFPSKALEAESALEAIAEQVHGSAELRTLVAATPAHRLLAALEASPGGHPVLESLRLYLERYGHQVYSLDFAVPTQADDPLPVLLSLKAQAQQPGRDARAHQTDMARQRDLLVEKTTRSLDPLRRRLFLRVLRWAQGFAPYREESLFYIGTAWPALRRLALEVGQRLAEAGSLSQPDDVFFLESAELAGAIQSRAAGQSRPDLVRLAQERRELREARKRLHPPAAVPPSAVLKLGPISLSGLETQKRNVGIGPVLRGFAVSPGRVTATASVILSPADFDKMRPDTVLACPTTTPAWTPLFAQARGLVTDIGGVSAHGSIVAREYGIPAVMGTGNGTQRIASGQLVTVDGDAGTVTLHASGGSCDPPAAGHDVQPVSQGQSLAAPASRPTSTLKAESPSGEEWNDSLAGDYLWTNANLAEAIPDVMTPCTWSLVHIFMTDAMSVWSVEGHQLSGNIGGRFYMNLSLLTTIGASLGLTGAVDAGNEQAFGRRPGDPEIPLIPISRWRLLRSLLPTALRAVRQMRADLKRLPAFLAAATERCESLRARIQTASSGRGLIELWLTEVEPYFHECSHMLRAAAKQDQNAIVTIRRDLQKLVGEADANELLSGLSAGSSELASLGPILGLEQLARGEIDRETFARRHGHRGPHEFEVSLPRPAEDPDWIERQLAGLRQAPVDVATLLARQEAAQAAAWERFRQRYPRQAAALRRRIDRAAAAFRDREAARSEVIRVFWVLRDFVLRAGALTGQGEDLFFLTIDEILAVLGGDEAPLARVPVRRATYERYSALPPYPALIRGHFDPLQWAADPNRRSDVFDATRESVPVSDAIRGFPGAAGVVEGRARVIAAAEEGDQLQAGEILVTIVTNVGWTPLFPRAAAVVTDVGAPLSHAAIVARELGIPAVVGCGNATMRLRTGDLVRVNGGQGTVEVLQRA